MLMQKEREEIVEYGKQMSAAGLCKGTLVYMIRKPDTWQSARPESVILRLSRRM